MELLLYSVSLEGQQDCVGWVWDVNNIYYILGLWGHAACCFWWQIFCSEVEWSGRIWNKQALYLTSSAEARGVFVSSKNILASMFGVIFWRLSRRMEVDSLHRSAYRVLANSTYLYLRRRFSTNVTFIQEFKQPKSTPLFLHKNLTFCKGEGWRSQLLERPRDLERTRDR